MTHDADSSIRFYLREISKTSLLTPAEEVELAARIRAGDGAARDHLIRANLRLVVKIAGAYSGCGLALSDLISEGNMGLMKAVERFDPEKGGKLSTYAAWWIKQAIMHALSHQSKTVRLSIHMLNKITRMRRISLMLAEALGREPTDSELAEELGISRHKVAMLKQASQRPASLDAPLNDGEATELGEIVADETIEHPAERMERLSLRARLDGALSTLSERERRIIDERFGLEGIKPMLLEDVGREFGVSRERIRQVQNAALEKLRKTLSRAERPSPRPLRGT